MQPSLSSLAPGAYDIYTTLLELPSRLSACSCLCSATCPRPRALAPEVGRVPAAVGSAHPVLRPFLLASWPWCSPRLSSFCEDMERVVLPVL